MSYLHAGGIDRPLTIWKRNGGAVRPHQNWRGLFFRGTWGTSSVPDTPPVGSAANCVTVNVNECLAINWPGERTTAWHESRRGESALWMGGLVDGMRDPTGQVYMRNRYYNPQTGQFTQMDPIGLAGGLNAYGFAAGDPVSFADPFGLCPFGQRRPNTDTSDCPDTREGRLVKEIDQHGGALGDSIIAVMVDRRLTPVLADSAAVQAQCYFPTACVAGRRLLINSQMDDRDVVGLLTHEIGHEMDVLPYRLEEPIQWGRAFRMMESVGGVGPWHRPFYDHWKRNAAEFFQFQDRAVCDFLARNRRMGSCE